MFFRPFTLLLLAAAPAWAALLNCGVTGAMERATSVPAGPAAVQLSAARNEWEAFQIIVDAPASASVSLSALKNRTGSPLPSAEIFREHNVTVTTPTPHSELGAGSYPDRLVPLADSASGSGLQTFWIDLQVPASAAAGDYTGTATVNAGDSEKIIPVTLHVWPFTLPERPALRTSFGAAWRRIAEISGLPADHASPAVQKRVAAFESMLAAHHLSPAAPFIPESEPYRTGTAVDFPSPSYERLFSSGHATSAPYPIWDGYPAADPLGAGRTSAQDGLARMARAAAARGWDRFFYFQCPVDEPDTAAAYAEVRRWGAFLRETERRHGVRIPMLVTEQPAVQNPTWGGLAGSVGVWVASFSDLNTDHGAVHERQHAGEEVWAYTGLVARPEKVPVWQIDFPPMNYRIAPWLCAKYDLTGLLYWDTLHWEKGVDPSRSAGSFVHPETGETFNGDGQLIYASPHGPLASLRLKWIREGMEDHALLTLARSSGLAAEVRTALDSAARSWSDWEKDPAAADGARLALGRALELSLTPAQPVLAPE